MRVARLRWCCPGPADAVLALPRCRRPRVRDLPVAAPLATGVRGGTPDAPANRKRGLTAASRNCWWPIAAGRLD